MRSGLLILLLVSTAVSVTLAVWWFRRVDQARVDPPIDIVKAPEQVRVMAGADEALEILLRPFSAEPGQDAFNRERLDELLGLRNPGFTYLKLWVVNRSAEARALSAQDLGRLSRPDDEHYLSRSLAELLAAAEEAGTLDPGRRFVLRGLARAELASLAPREIAEFVVALPREPDWQGLDRLVVPAVGGLELRAAELSASALEDFLARPRGRLLDRLVFPAREPATLQASRK